jgi:uracil-DNA glycosylase family 4
MSEFAKPNLENALKWYDIMEIDLPSFPRKRQSSIEKLDPRLGKDDNRSVDDAKKNNDNTESRILANKASTIEELRDFVMNFNGCELKNTATNTVFADGISSSKIMLIGEAPGVSEDEQGIPFCGQSGQLLDNMMQTIDLSRKENIYISNTIFWRPPANRRPTEAEIEICRPFVEKHIALVKPKLLVLVGATALTSLLGDHLQISRIRQEYYQYTNQYLSEPITTTAIFHPAYLLRQPFQKKATWYDLLKIQQFLQK